MADRVAQQVYSRAAADWVCRTCGLCTDHCECPEDSGDPETWPAWTDEVRADVVVVDLTFPVVEVVVNLDHFEEGGAP